MEIGAYKIKVERGEIPDEHEMFGFYKMTNNGATIVIDSRLTGVRELATFLHELFHAIDDVGGLGLQHRQIDGLGELAAQALGKHLKF